MRHASLLMLGLSSLALAACADDPRPVFGTGAWRFSSEPLTTNCTEDARERLIAGEHGDLLAGGESLVARCTARALSGGGLSVNFTLNDGSGNGVDVRDMRIPAAAASSSTQVRTTPTACNSMLFEVSGARYEAFCTTSEPDAGECQLVGGALDKSAGRISVEFRCHDVPNLGNTSTCEVSGAGSTSAVISFDECKGL